MDYTEFIVDVPKTFAQTATDIATALCSGGLYIEDYADIEQQVKAIAHVDLIEEELLKKPKDRVIIHLYVGKDENVAEFSQNLKNLLLAQNVPYILSTKGVKNQDWENSWKQYYHPIEIGQRLAIAPSWENYKSQRIVLKMDPGMAFGTGTHETTALCLGVLDAKIKGGEEVLDVGTGSGILAVAALLLGAKSALGVDIDPMAVRTATENAQRNGVEKQFAAFAGDLAQKATGKYDVITANIVADAILRLAPSVLHLLKPKGIFVASGIIDTREEELVCGLESAGLTVLERLFQRGWLALVLQKK